MSKNDTLVFTRNVDISFIVSGSERTFTFHMSLNTLPTLATLVRDIIPEESSDKDGQPQEILSQSPE